MVYPSFFFLPHNQLAQTLQSFIRYCPTCKDFRRAAKRFELWKLPQLLVIHLKRFQYDDWSRDKLTTYCDFPLKGLDLSKYVIGDKTDCIYDLYAVSVR